MRSTEDPVMYLFLNVHSGDFLSVALKNKLMQKN